MAGGHKVSHLLLVVSLAWLAAPSSGLAQQTEDSCAACHSALEPRLANPVEGLSTDIHGIKGFGCVTCHGGDAREFGMEAMDPGKGYIGAPSRSDILALCGRCHSDAQFMKRYNPALRVDQVAEYQSSVHGQLFSRNNDPNVATCVSCHPAHAIKPPSEPTSSVHPLRVADTCGTCHADPELMAAYSIPTNQLERYSESVHWQMLSVEGDVSAPTCNDCHGNHGAAPPGISWVGNVCGQCHSVMGDLFANSFHSQVFQMLGTPGCATCHGNHGIKPASDEMLGLGEGAACAMCHSGTDRGGLAATEMRALIDSLSSEFEEASLLLSEAEHAGMEVSQAQFELEGARNALVSARATIHSFSVEAVSEEVAAGLEITQRAQVLGEEALDDLQFRRIGLAISVSLILALIVGLVLKIRSLEEKREPSTAKR